MKFIKYRGNKWAVMTYVQNACLWLKNKLVSVLAIGQLYHQPGCTTQLRDVRGLPFPVIRSSKPVSCTFVDKFYSSSFSGLIKKIPNQLPSTVAF